MKNQIRLLGFATSIILMLGGIQFDNMWLHGAGISMCLWIALENMTDGKVGI